VLRTERRAHILSIGVLLLLGVLQALWYRNTLNPDGVAYLDLSDDVLAGRWGSLVQAYWSPIYPMLLAAGRVVVGTGAEFESAIAHAVNFGGFVFALAGWYFLLHALARRQLGLVPFETPLGIVCGYSVFAWAMLWLMSLHFITPDVWLAGWTFMAAALVLRHGDGMQPRDSLLLGVVLGTGYLTKSVLLPVAPFFIAGALLLTPAPQRTRAALRALAALGLIAVPWMAAISVREGRATFGDNGRFNYAWFVSGDRWLSPDPARETGPGASVFSRIHQTPAVYGWPDKPGTYAPWRGPSAWHGSMSVTLNAAGQVRALERSWRLLAFWLAPWGILLVVIVAGGAQVTRAAASAAVAVGVPALAASAGYALVFMEGRYAAPFLAVLVMAVIALLRVRETESRRVVLSAMLGVVLWMTLDPQVPAMTEMALGLIVYVVLLARGAPPLSLTALASAGIIAIGGAHVMVRAAGDGGRVLAGDTMLDAATSIRRALASAWWRTDGRIGIIGDGPTSAVWARQLRARIVAELPVSQASAFWASPDSVRTAIAHAMRDVGAREIIASGALPADLPPGWHRVPGAAAARYALDEP
jgi:hypothetical protein